MLKESARTQVHGEARWARESLTNEGARTASFTQIQADK